MKLTYPDTASCRKGQMKVFCCDSTIDTSGCYWNEGETVNNSFCTNSYICKQQNEIRVISDPVGGFDNNGNSHSCNRNRGTPLGLQLDSSADLAFCCPNSITGTVSSS